VHGEDAGALRQLLDRQGQQRAHPLARLLAPASLAEAVLRRRATAQVRGQALVLRDDEQQVAGHEQVAGQRGDEVGVAPALEQRQGAAEAGRLGSAVDRRRRARDRERAVAQRRDVRGRAELGAEVVQPVRDLAQGAPVDQRRDALLRRRRVVQQRARRAYVTGRGAVGHGLHVGDARGQLRVAVVRVTASTARKASPATIAAASTSGSSGASRQHVPRSRRAGGAAAPRARQGARS